MAVAMNAPVEDIPDICLSNGVSIPQLGLGTSHNGGYNEDTLLHALRLGVLHLDTAQRYGTEAAIGHCISSLDIDRSRMFLTTKLWPGNYSDITEATKTSLTNLQTDYIDLYFTCRRQ